MAGRPVPSMIRPALTATVFSWADVDAVNAAMSNALQKCWIFMVPLRYW